jgi:hypothetical protein
VINEVKIWIVLGLVAFWMIDVLDDGMPINALMVTVDTVRLIT